MPPRPRSGFTLLEILIVIAIIAVLSVILIIILNPVEMLAQGRDSNRVADFATLKTALGAFRVGSSTASMGVVSTTYVSVPDPSATSTVGDQCQGLALPILPSGQYHCAASSTYQNIDGTGWIPVNFSSLAGGSPISGLPIDPVNSDVQNAYYTYTTNGNQYELTAPFESQKFQAKTSNDGGPYSDLYEYGTKLTLAPIDFKLGVSPPPTNGLVAYWNFDEAAGSTIADSSGNGNNAAAQGTTIVAGKSGNARSFSGGSDYASTTATLNLSSYNQITITFWLYWNAFANNDNLAFEFSANANLNLNSFIINPNSGGGACGGSGAFDVGYNGNMSWNEANFSRPSAGAWHHYAIVMDTTQTANEIGPIYVDGQSQTLTRGCTNNNTSNFGNYTLYMMSRAGGSLFAAGQLDGVRVYNRVLSLTEVQTIYAAQK